MKKTLEIIRYELGSALQRKSYLFIAFGIPLLGVLIFAGINLVRSNASTSDNSENEQNSFQYKTEGFIDQAGIIKDFPDDLPENILLPFPNEDAAKIALENSQISAYYLIPEDYIESGDLVYVHPTVNPIGEGGQSWVMIWTLYFNLLEGDMELASNVWSPAYYVRRNLSATLSQDGVPSDECSTPGFACESNLLIQMLPILVMVIVYVSIITGGSYLLRLISSEKDNRIMEILLLSASPNQLLNGKVISYCILGFFQVLAWMGAVFLVFRIGGVTLNLPGDFSLPVSLLIWGLVFFVLGYGIYATMMAGAGALTPKLTQYTSVYFIVSMPLMISYLFSLMLAMRPNSPLAIGLSLFPLSAPIMMITRLTIGNVPIWQPILASILTIGMAILIISAVARMFRAQLLLSGEPFSLQRYLRALMNSR